MYLLDTNIFIELLLEQEKAEDVRKFLINHDPCELYITGRFNFDFDDAYQYLIAEKYDLTIISFDSDFDRTEQGRKTPADILKT